MILAHIYKLAMLRSRALRSSWHQRLAPLLWFVDDSEVFPCLPEVGLEKHESGDLVSHHVGSTVLIFLVSVHMVKRGWVSFWALKLGLNKPASFQGATIWPCSETRKRMLQVILGKGPCLSMFVDCSAYTPKRDGWLDPKKSEKREQVPCRRPIFSPIPVHIRRLPPSNTARKSIHREFIQWGIHEKSRLKSYRSGGLRLWGYNTAADLWSLGVCLFAPPACLDLLSHLRKSAAHQEFEDSLKNHSKSASLECLEHVLGWILGEWKAGEEMTR